MRWDDDWILRQGQKEGRNVGREGGGKFEGEMSERACWLASSEYWGRGIFAVKACGYPGTEK